jgi:hypothetical protein
MTSDGWIPVAFHPQSADRAVDLAASLIERLSNDRARQ